MLNFFSDFAVCNSVSSAADRAYDYVILTTKAGTLAVPDVITTPQVLAPLLSSPYADRYRQPAYVLLQNGLNVEKDLYDAIKALDKEEPKVIGCALWIGTNLRAPDVVEHNDFVSISVSPLDLLSRLWHYEGQTNACIYRPGDFTATSNTPKETEVLEGIASILESGGSTVSIVSEIQRVKFAKNFWNVAFSSFATLTNYTLPAIFRDPPTDSIASYSPYLSPKTAQLVQEYTIPSIEAILQELLAVGRAIGFPDAKDGLPSSIVQGTIQNTAALHVKPNSAHVPSMLLDMRNDSPIEVEVIVGEVVRMARARSVPVPVSYSQSPKTVHVNLSGPLQRIETLYALLLVVQNQIIRNMEEKSRL
ncbi:hypothetical protein D9758_001785 [Tetrapyrgos nigripes]|uniref:Ketopantoate reductase C-terminal domain-containing protein n=1 Tax=Tetrapyrgos nigripes TaxID=182062 RepID=A0A8H5LXH6_9AGAR|nr:hypothetical protein D9758_001785 [Tetrapyrgos nigripes]